MFTSITPVEYKHNQSKKYQIWESSHKSNIVHPISIQQTSMCVDNLTKRHLELHTEGHNSNVVVKVKTNNNGYQKQKNKKIWGSIKYRLFFPICIVIISVLIVLIII